MRRPAWRSASGGCRSSISRPAATSRWSRPTAASSSSYNGEIYNYRELRAELEADGVTVPRHSDTEVMLALRSRVGRRAALAALCGMFAIALWDRRRADAVARRATGSARSRSTTRTRRGTLLVRLGAEGAARPSRLSAPRSIATRWRRYLRYGYVPAPATHLRRRAASCRPGCYRACSRRSGAADVQPYWTRARGRDAQCRRAPRRRPSDEAHRRARGAAARRGRGAG